MYSVLTTAWEGYPPRTLLFEVFSVVVSIQDQADPVFRPWWREQATKHGCSWPVQARGFDASEEPVIPRDSPAHWRYHGHQRCV